ncbi:hypothetical protein EXIGLDRAFT_638638 [Exidia glandulosa HHB12029]|uniref:Conidiation-specific protein 13 n=1 Tax=Exidia glandulosa HHB12029 TaxID=1314781 RepID=A0A165NPR4_EXIGL|nr:hypothetical protein EXIGLDRAFT_638638 [Exidia glandulosa HHB12029]
MLSIIVLATIALALPTSASLGKPVLFKDGIDAHVGASFWANLKPAKVTSDQWSWGWIPQTCRNNAKDNGVSPYDMEVFNVRYADCAMAWVFCRHHRADLSQAEMIDLFGRLPVHERQWVRHVMAFPGNTPGIISAYASNGDIAMQGDTASPMFFQHETTHVLDFYRNNGSSSTAQWKAAIAKDSCVPEDYSNTNEIEDYATIGLMSLYEIITPGGLDPIGNWRCLVNQKNALDAFQRSDMIPGGTCSRRTPNDLNVKMGPAAGLVAQINGPVSPPEGVTLGNLPAPFKVGPHAFQNFVRNETEMRKAKVLQEKWMSEGNRNA